MSPCRPVRQAWKEKLLSPRGQFARAAAITDVVTQPHNAGAVWCWSSHVWQGAHHTHGTHPRTHTQTPTNCCPAQQGCESRATTARGPRKASDRLLQGHRFILPLFRWGRKGPRSHCSFQGPQPIPVKNTGQHQGKTCLQEVCPGVPSNAVISGPLGSGFELKTAHLRSITWKKISHWGRVDLSIGRFLPPLFPFSPIIAIIGHRRFEGF